jgi:hypothetical protein
VTGKPEITEFVPVCRQSARDWQFDLLLGWMNALACSRRLRISKCSCSLLVDMPEDPGGRGRVLRKLLAAAYMGGGKQKVENARRRSDNSED